MTPEEGMRQAAWTAQYYMIEAIKDIDELFGNGYAKQNPHLVGAYMAVAAQDFATAARLHREWRAE